MSRPYSLTEEFTPNFWDGVRDENRVAHLLRMAGFGVFLPAPRVREEFETRKKFEGTLDLRVYKTDVFDNLTVEVKGTSAPFTAPGDWPFHDVACYATNKSRHPDLLVLFSRETCKAMGLLPSDGLYRRNQKDNRPNRDGLSYEVWAAEPRLLRSWEGVLQQLNEMLESPRLPGRS